MRRRFDIFTAIVLFAMFFASCREDTTEIPQYVGGRIEAKQTDWRVNDGLISTSVEKTDGILPLVWRTEDKIGIFPDTGLQVVFSIADGAGTKSAIFDGVGLGIKSSSTYCAYYPLIAEFYHDKKSIPLSLTEQTQIGNNNANHLASFNYMAATNATEDASGNLSFLFQHQVCILHIQLKMPCAGTYTSLILETNGSFTTKALLNLTDGHVTATRTSAIQAASLTNVSINSIDDYLEVYMCILPTNLKGKVLRAKIYDNEGKCYTANIKGSDFVAGTIYNIGVSASEDINTGLPVVIINTPNNASIKSKSIWTKKSLMAIIKPDGCVDYDDNALQIRGRGHYTWQFPKKPFTLKLDNKSELLGMSENKRWILMANWMDRTLIRNDVSFQIAQQTGLAWSPRGEFVEVVLNGTHIGNYYLCEQIRIDKNRVNLTEMTTKDIEGDAITGGYLLELDIKFDEANKFHSSAMNYPYMIKEPDKDILQPEQLSWLEKYIGEMEEKLYADDWLVNREYTDYINLESFVDWWFVYELSGNGEPNHPKSTFMHKDRLGKLTAGPVWDFDWGTYITRTDYYVKNAVYYKRLFCDPTFVTIIKERWTIFKPSFEGVSDYIRTIATKIKVSNEIDKKIWPMSAHSAGSANGDQDLTFDEAIERMVSAYQAKLKWLDSKISEM